MGITVVLIENPLKEEIARMENRRESLEPIVFQEGGCLPELKEELIDVNDKLRAMYMYRDLYNKKSVFERIKDLKFKNPNRYIQMCREMVAEIKGIDFDKNSGLFRVRIQRKKERIYIGSFDTPNEAVNALEMWVK